jgi:hypothetical protein
MSGEQRQSDSFVLRIWWEEGEASPVWRGWVQHATSGESNYFDQITELLAFVETRTGSLTEGGDPRPGGGQNKKR